MAHTQERSTWVREGQLAIVGGALYGASHTISGHPLDNVKASMQLDPRYRGLGAFETAGLMWRRDGLRGFLRGCLPPLWGSTVYRSVMMSTYEACYTALDRYDKSTPLGAALHAEVLGARPLVLVSAVACSLSRCVVEAPIEYAKVMGQTGRPWVLNDIYVGLPMQVIRTTSMLVLIFVPYDICRRYTTWFSTLSGQCAVTTSVCVFAYAACWPAETLKNLAQAGKPFPRASVTERVASLGGLRGLYIGAGPGIICGGFRNGCAMLVMAKYHEIASRCGLRD